MQSRSSNPRVSDLLLALTALEVLVLLASGGGLLAIPDDLAAIWPWELPPFNAAFFGAVYLASLLSAAMLAYTGRWSPARIVLPMILLFTAVLFVLTLVYLDRFELVNAFTWIWLALYTLIPLNAAYHLWLYRGWKPAGAAVPGGAVRVLLLLIAAVYGLYGLGLLAAPGPFSAFWPWAVDEFHARMYSVAFLTPALGALLLLRAAAWAEVFSLGLTLAGGGLFTLLGFLLVALRLGRVDWAAPGTWLWLALFAGFLASGLALLGAARRLPRPSGRLNDGGFVVSIRLVALFTGLAFTAAGIAGFLPVFTHAPPPGAPPLLLDANYGYLLGIFPINLPHNLFHLLIGLLGLALWRRERSARLYVRGFALALAVLTVAGLAPGLNSVFGLAPIFGHDVWLHGVEAFGAAYAGFWMPGTREGEKAAGQEVALHRP